MTIKEEDKTPEIDPSFKLKLNQSIEGKGYSGHFGISPR
jgi:hypothetical protein